MSTIFIALAMEDIKKENKCLKELWKCNHSFHINLNNKTKVEYIFKFLN